MSHAAAVCHNTQSIVMIRASLKVGRVSSNHQVVNGFVGFHVTLSSKLKVTNAQ